MTADRKHDDGSAARPTCPWCDQPVRSVVVSGPTEAIAGPCGCRVPISSVSNLERD